MRLLVLCLALSALACSAKQIGLNRMADALTATANAYARDNDPELVRLAAPSTLKLVEMMLDDQPAHPGLLLTACSGFTQYAYAFLQIEADIAQPANASLAVELRGRAGSMYVRARGYCLRALEVRHRGFREVLARDSKVALDATDVRDVAPLFWYAVAIAGEVSVATTQITRLGDVATARAVLQRALALDETWQLGAIHEVMIAFEGLPALLGGSADRAQKHFDRAVALSSGQSAFAYVTMASSVAAPRRDRAGFDRLLKSALAVDVNRFPELRLANLIAQKRARSLQARAAELFSGR